MSRSPSPAGTSMAMRDDADEAHPALDARALRRQKQQELVAARRARQNKKRARARISDDEGDSYARTALDDDTDALFGDLDDLPDVVPVPAFQRRDASDDDDDSRAARGGPDSAPAATGDGLDLVLDDWKDGAKNGEEGAKKKRRTLAKMDDQRLLGDDGFPKLRDQVLKFKLKGKGHEVQDLKRLMTMYQLWAHQMYPRTNFRDTLKTVEKLCHKRSVARSIKDYRNQLKQQKQANAVAMAMDTSEPRDGVDDAPNDARASVAPTQPKRAVTDDDMIDDEFDEFEALRELEEAASKKPPPTKSAPNDWDDFDEMEAMRELEMSSSRAPPPPVTKARSEYDEADELEAMMELEAQATAVPATKTAPPQRLVGEDPYDDDLDDEGWLKDLEAIEKDAPQPKSTAATKPAIDEDEEMMLRALEEAEDEEAERMLLELA